MNNVVQFQEHRYCTEKFVLHVHVCLCMAKYCTSIQCALLHKCMQLVHVTGNFFSLMLCLHKMPSTSVMFLVLKLPSFIAMPCPLSSSVYTCSYMYGILRRSLIIISSYLYTLSMFCFVKLHQLYLEPIWCIWYIIEVLGFS